MDRFEIFYDQLPTEDELNGMFDAVESAEHDTNAEAGLIGVQSGLVVSPANPESLLVQVSAGVGRASNGERCSLEAVAEVDLSVDSLDVSTAVLQAGNQKIVSLFCAMERSDTVPRIDGHGQTIYWSQAEGIAWYIVQGAEAVNPTPPPLQPGKILVADIRRAYGVSTIASTDISTPCGTYDLPLGAAARRQDAFVLTTGDGTQLRAGTAEESDQNIVDAMEVEASGYLQAHLDDTTDAHNSTAISAVAAGASFTGAPFSLAESDVGTQLSDLLLLANHPYRVREISADHTVDSGGIRDGAIFATTTGGAFNVTLPSPSANKGRKIRLFDAGGVFSSNPVTLVRNGTEKINGVQASYPLHGDWGRWTIESNGTDWFVA